MIRRQNKNVGKGGREKKKKKRQVKVPRMGKNEKKRKKMQIKKYKDRRRNEEIKDDMKKGRQNTKIDKRNKTRTRKKI